jgi:hypothetical protein
MPEMHRHAVDLIGRVRAVQAGCGTGACRIPKPPDPWRRGGASASLVPGPCEQIGPLPAAYLGAAAGLVRAHAADHNRRDDDPINPLWMSVIVARVGLAGWVLRVKAEMTAERRAAAAGVKGRPFGPLRPTGVTLVLTND